MNREICIKISETILSVLVSQTKIKDEIICDPQKYYSTIHKLTSGVLGVAIAHNLRSYSDQIITLNDTFGWLKKNLGKQCLFVKNFNLFSADEILALNGFQKWYCSQKFDKINLSDLYELILSLDFPIENGIIIKGYEEEIENVIGSFYTPKTLADKCVELTMNQYIFQNTGIVQFSKREKNEKQVESVLVLLSESSFADHACGTGRLLLAIIKYVKVHFSEDAELLKKIVLNFIAIEADELALEIAKLEIVTAINSIEIYQQISKNFIRGNPLLQTNGTSDSFAFSDNFYYHNEMIINAKYLPKCDVIMGNPPWGEVSFDYDFFFHTVCPKLKEIEGEEQLTQAVFRLEFTHPKLYNWFLEHENATIECVENIYEDVRFGNSNAGGLNTNALFTELADSLCSERGTVGLILKSATLSDSINRKLLKYLQNRNRIVMRYDFINTNGIFRIDADERFSVVVLGNNVKSSFLHRRNLTNVSEIN